MKASSTESEIVTVWGCGKHKQDRHSQAPHQRLVNNSVPYDTNLCVPFNDVKWTWTRKEHKMMNSFLQTNPQGKTKGLWKTMSQGDNQWHDHGV